jgi:rhamnulokinase/L-fuculokinase
MIEEAARLIDIKKLYSLTGNQVMEINTAFQLLAEKRLRPYIPENGYALLPIPDLLGFMLTGEISAELSIASTTQLFDPNRLDWSDEAIAALELPRKLFPKIVKPGESKGVLSPELCRELNIPAAEVTAVCGHDTQCAAFAAPAAEKDFIFLSSGTWSLFGTVLDKPLINDTAAQLNITNEVGVNGKITFLKNITGLWLVQETKAFLESQGEEYSFAELEALARECDDFTAFINPDAEEFSVSGDMPSAVRSFCKRTGQNIPDSLGEIMRTIYLSLAMSYRLALEQISCCTGKSYNRIYTVGGGTKDKLLCKLTADVCGIPVTAGPVEATVMGNAAIQLLRNGAIRSEADIPVIISNSEKLQEFSPQGNYDRQYEDFKKIIL